nr:PREDICTED: uncharacterized protein LOC105661820 [Megachile rotundata]
MPSNNDPPVADDTDIPRLHCLCVQWPLSVTIDSSKRKASQGDSAKYQAVAAHDPRLIGADSRRSARRKRASQETGEDNFSRRMAGRIGHDKTDKHDRTRRFDRDCKCSAINFAPVTGLGSFFRETKRIKGVKVAGKSACTTLRLNGKPENLLVYQALWASP